MLDLSRTALRTLLIGSLVRYVLFLCGAGAYLATRVEISTSANGLLPIKEGIALLRLGASPYRGSTCHAPPLVLYWMDRMLPSATSGLIADMLAASMLRSIGINMRTAGAPSSMSCMACVADGASQIVPCLLP